MIEVEYYRDRDGHELARDFIDGLDVKMKVKVIERIALLEEYGNMLRMPYSQLLDDGVFELRTPQGNNITRVLYFFVTGNKAILTHGFVKKTQKTPRREIEKAKRCREDWRERNE